MNSNNLLCRNDRLLKVSSRIDADSVYGTSGIKTLYDNTKNNVHGVEYGKKLKLHLGGQIKF